MTKVHNSSIIIRTSNGFQLEVCRLGASIKSLKIPNKTGALINVIAGLSDCSNYRSSAYEQYGLCLGSIVGRFAGRIGAETIEIDNNSFPIYANNGVHLHGGQKGFQNHIWDITDINRSQEPSVSLSYTSQHLEEGYPGNLKVVVTYRLNEALELSVDIRATTDKTTLVNLTNHAYFNLNGGGSIAEHDLFIASNTMLETDARNVPTGRIQSTKDTVYDYETKRSITSEHFKGIDDCFLLAEHPTKAILSSAASGIEMQVSTNQKSLVIYTPPEFPDLPFFGDYKKAYPAICFEAQAPPDSPRHEHFGSCILEPGQSYNNTTKFKFSIH